MGPQATTLVLAAPAENNELTGLVGVEMGELSRDIADDGVAGATPEQLPRMLEVVEYAHSKGHDVSFVVIDQVQPRFTLYRDIANQLQEQVGGTVIVLGPNSVGSSSPDFSRVVQEQATDGLTLTDPAGAARQMIDTMTGPNVDWTIVGVLLVLVVAIGAVLARLRRIRIRKNLAAGPLGPVQSAGTTSDEPSSRRREPSSSGR
ncbi:Rv1476 family membrane protein [Gordonia terrae]